MTFNDIFKSSFLEKVTSFSILDTMIALVLAFALGLFIFLIYKRTYKGVMYSSSFGISLVALTLITTLVILAVTSNVVLSLGMVGALSIVRFRTAIKEPLDIAFLFWSIAVGIVLGAGIVSLAIIGSVFIGIVLLIFVNKKPADNPYVLVVQCQNETTEGLVLDKVKETVKKYVVKSKSVTPTGIEFTIEVRLKDMGTSFVNNIAGVEGVNHTALVSYNGDYMA